AIIYGKSWVKVEAKKWSISKKGSTEVEGGGNWKDQRQLPLQHNGHFVSLKMPIFDLGTNAQSGRNTTKLSRTRLYWIARSSPTNGLHSRDCTASQRPPKPPIRYPLSGSGADPTPVRV
ncbi:hypothetical protein LB506_002163, partial [Fusarium annulatum]